MAVFGYSEVHLRDYVYVLKKRRYAIIVFFILSLVIGFFLTISERVLFRAVTTVMIERENPNVVDFKEVMAVDNSATEYYQTQYQMLKSRTLMRELIKKNQLQEDAYLVGLQKGGFKKIIRENPYLGKRFGSFFSEPSLEDVLIRKIIRVDPIRNSRLVEVSALHPDPEQAAKIVNSLAELYIQRNLDDRFLTSQQATELISKQLVELKDRVAIAETNLQKYKEEKGIVNLPSIREKDKFIQDAKLELVKIQAEESKLSKRYLPAHPKRIHLRSEIEGLEEKINSEEQKTLSISRDAIQYQQLEREAESTQQIYESLLKRMQETQSESKTQASNILVVDHAEVPARPYKPRLLLNFFMAFTLGIMGGIFLSFFMEYLDSTVKIPEDIEKGLALDLLAIVPNEDLRGKEIFFDPHKHSPAAEAIRALRTSLLFRLRHIPGCRTILLTSPNPSEGKTSIAANLAFAFEQNHLKVLLIDADLRKPRIHKIFNLTQERGLSEILEGEVPLEEVLHKNVGGLGFDLLSAGAHSHHPTEILGSREMTALFEKLEKKYDIILLDSPPYLAVADVPVLSEFASAVVVVAGYQKTDRSHLRDLKRRFSGPKINTLGVVINRVGVREKDYYYQQYYYYGYGSGDSQKTK